MKCCVQNWEGVRPHLTALGNFEGRVGEQSMNVRFYLKPDPHADNAADLAR